MTAAEKLAQCNPVRYSWVFRMHVYYSFLFLVAMLQTDSGKLNKNQDYNLDIASNCNIYLLLLPQLSGETFALRLCVCDRND